MRRELVQTVTLDTSYKEMIVSYQIRRKLMEIVKDFQPQTLTFVLSATKVSLLWKENVRLGMIYVQTILNQKGNAWVATLDIIWIKKTDVSLLPSDKL